MPASTLAGIIQEGWRTKRTVYVHMKLLRLRSCIRYCYDMIIKDLCLLCMHRSLFLLYHNFVEYFLSFFDYNTISRESADFESLSNTTNFFIINGDSTLVNKPACFTF